MLSPKLSQGCDTPGHSQGTGTRQLPLVTAHSRKCWGCCYPVAFQRVFCLSPINLQQIKDRETHTKKKKIIKQNSSSSQALRNPFFPVSKTNHVIPVWIKREKDCPCSIPPPLAAVCKARVDRRGKGSIFPQIKVVFLPK